MNYTTKELCERIIETMDSDQVIEVLEVPTDILVWSLEEYIGDNHHKFEDIFE